MDWVGRWAEALSSGEQGIKFVLAFAAETLAEFINLTSGIHNLLLPGEERMALRTYINAHSFIAISRARNEGFPATAGNTYVLIIRMYFRFHDLIIRYGFLF